MASQSHIVADAAQAGASPFIATLPLHGDGAQNLASVTFTIAPAAGAVSKPVTVRQSMAYLTRRGYLHAGDTAFTLPVFGLYAGQTNAVTLTLAFTDGSTIALPASVATPAYVDTNNTYDHRTVVKQRPAGSSFGLDYVYLKSGLGSPVIVDTDGNVRWMAPNVTGTKSSVFSGGGFIVGAPDSTAVTRVELDGTVSALPSLQSPGAIEFTHNIETSSKTGMLAELDVNKGTFINYRSTGVEWDPSTGLVSNVWDFADILTSYMTSQGDDASAFVRPGLDWFHMNTLIYDPRDDSIIASSRENFLMKVDYSTKAIKWILGDTTKYWYTFPSLRAKALVQQGSGLVPVGQHAVTIAPDGDLTVFNNGAASFEQPAGEPDGLKRTYSAVSAYKVDPVAGTWSEHWHFDYSKTLSSRLCSSTREMPDGTAIVNYAMTDNGLTTHLVGLDPSHAVLFDYVWPNSGGCKTSWNAQPIALDAMSFDN